MYSVVVRGRVFEAPFRQSGFGHRSHETCTIMSEGIMYYTKTKLNILYDIR